MYRPSPRTAAVRLICLTSLTLRGLLEGANARAGPTGRQDEYAEIARLLAWLRKQRLWNRLSVCECQAMAKPSGAWDEREQTNASWRAEAAGVLAWSLKLLGQVPPYDTEFGITDIWAAVPGIGADTKDFVRGAMLRPEDEIRDAREMAEAWVWRVRTTLSQTDSARTGQTSPEKYAQYIKSAAKRGMEKGWFVAISEDFPAFRKAYADLSPGEFGRVASIAQERLWALNWLCGPGRSWDHVLLDT